MSQYTIYALIICLIGLIGISGITCKYMIESKAIEAGLQQCVVINGAGVNIIWQRECKS
jgi:hypothetical protein